MPLQAPRLDDRTFQNIVDEAKQRIPHYCSEWTDHNVSDPGVTLIELFAWMTELMLYRMNQVPDLHYIKFMQMFGVELRPPTAARTNVSFWLSAAQPTGATIEAGTRVATTQTETQHSVSFVTDEDFRICTPELAAVLKESSDPNGQRGLQTLELQQLKMRPGADQKGLPIFSSIPKSGDALYLGFHNNLSHHLLRIVWSFKTAAGVGIDPQNAPLVWEATNEQGGWTSCDLDEDTTQGLNSPDGHTQLHLPAMAQQDIAGRYLYWLRLRVREPKPQEIDKSYKQSPLLQQLGAVQSVGCTVAATHCEVSNCEVLGRSDGSPGQRFRLQGTPMLPPQAGETLLVFTGEPGRTEPDEWREVPDFADSQPHDPHFMLDRIAGEVRLAPALRQQNGQVRLYGRVPPRGASLVFSRYRFGGGTEGNLGAGRLNTLKTAIPFVRKVCNRNEAQGGLDAETLDAAMMRMPQLLRTRDSAITAADYRTLARSAAPAYISRAECLAPEAGGSGNVTVLVLPRLPEVLGAITPGHLLLAEDVRRQVEAYLDARRLLTTRVEVRTPQYVWASVAVQLTLEPGHDRARVQAAVLERLHRLIHPLVGGPSGEGWPLGRNLYVGDVYQALLGIAGVRFIRNINLSAMGDYGVVDETGQPEVSVPSDAVLVSGEHSVVFV